MSVPNSDIPIQRWCGRRETDEMFWADDGPWVKYADHVAAVAEAEERGWANGSKFDTRMALEHREQGQRDALAKAVVAVEKVSVFGGNWDDGIRATYLAAIKAVAE